MQNAAKTYVQTQVGTTTQGDILILLFDGAIKFLHQAKERMAEKNYAQKGILISKALDILTELQGSLNANKGGDLASNLQRLYFYCSTQLLNANLKMDVSKVDEVLQILSGLRDAFSQANAAAGANPAAALNAQAVAAAPAASATAQQAAAPAKKPAPAEPAQSPAAAKPAFNVYAIPRRAPAAGAAPQAEPVQAPSVQVPPASATRLAPTSAPQATPRPTPVPRQPAPPTVQAPVKPLSPASGAAKKAFAAYAGAQKNSTSR